MRYAERRQDDGADEARPVLARVAVNHHRQVLGLEQMREELRQHRRECRRHAVVDQHHAPMNARRIGLSAYGIDELVMTGTRVVADIEMQSRRLRTRGPAVLRGVAFNLATQIADQTDVQVREGLEVLLRCAAEGLRSV